MISLITDRTAGINCMVWFSYTWIWNETYVCILIPRRDITRDDMSLLKTILEQLIAECSTAVALSWRPDVVGTLTSVLKLMRNLCAGVPLNQEMIL